MFNNIVYSFTEIATSSNVQVDNLIDYSEQFDVLADKLSSIYSLVSTSNFGFFLLLISFILACTLMFRLLWK